MICRMNKRQRDCLIELIRATIADAREDSDCQETLHRLNAEEDFHKCFEDQSEDDLDHVKSS